MPAPSKTDLEDPEPGRSSPASLDRPFDIDITIDDPAWEVLLRAIDIPHIISMVWETLDQPKSAELSLAFVDDSAIASLNHTYRGKDGPTNVLSFPAGDNPHMLGDIVMARETVLREAAESAKPVADHITHLLIHGFLHLHDYDHMTEDEAQAMEAIEISVLSQLGIDNPYEIRKA